MGFHPWPYFHEKRRLPKSPPAIVNPAVESVKCDQSALDAFWLHSGLQDRQSTINLACPLVERTAKVQEIPQMALLFVNQLAFCKGSLERRKAAPAIFSCASQQFSAVNARIASTEPKELTVNWVSSLPWFPHMMFVSVILMLATVILFVCSLLFGEGGGFKRVSGLPGLPTHPSPTHPPPHQPPPHPPPAPPPTTRPVFGDPWHREVGRNLLRAFATTPEANGPTSPASRRARARTRLDWRRFAQGSRVMFLLGGFKHHLVGPRKVGVPWRECDGLREICI